MTKEQAFNIGLPKWPQCIIKGEKISEEQALNIIRRTDNFFHGCYGNNREFNNKAYEIIKRPDRNNYTDDNIDTYIKDTQIWRNEWQLINTHYLGNDWISSSYIGGPNGWCHPDGTIEYHYNIGKWPDVEEVYNELCIYATEFPFLNMTVTLMSGESCADDAEPLVSMKVYNGEVTFIETLSLDDLKYEDTPDVSMNLIFSSNKDYENYFDLDQIQKWADEVFN